MTFAPCAPPAPRSAAQDNSAAMARARPPRRSDRRSAPPGHRWPKGRAGFAACQLSNTPRRMRSPATRVMQDRHERHGKPRQWTTTAVRPSAIRCGLQVRHRRRSPRAAGLGGSVPRSGWSPRASAGCLRPHRSAHGGTAQGIWRAPAWHRSTATRLLEWPQSSFIETLSASEYMVSQITRSASRKKSMKAASTAIFSSLCSLSVL